MGRRKTAARSAHGTLSTWIYPRRRRCTSCRSWRFSSLQDSVTWWFGELNSSVAGWPADKLLGGIMKRVLLGITCSTFLMVATAYAQGGTVTGTVKFTGAAPANPKIDMSEEPTCKAKTPN